LKRKKPLINQGPDSPLLSKKAARFSELLIEIRWFLALASCIGLFCILVTYAPNDPAWSNNSGGLVKNIGGRLGAYLADLMLFIFGASAYWWVILFARHVAQGWKSVVRSNDDLQVGLEFAKDSIWVRWLGFLMVLCSSVSLESIRLHTLQMALPNLPGGVLGEMIGDPLQTLLGFTGSTLFLLCIFFAGISLFFHFSWLNFSEQIGRWAEVFYLKIRNRQESVVDRRIGEIAAFEREEHVEEELDKFDTVEPIQIVRQESVIQKSDRVEREKQTILFDDLSGAALPPLSLLDAAPASVESISADTLEFTSRLIERKLKDFGVEAKVIAAYPGPIITRYEIEPAIGVKGSQIVNLSKDLNRALGTQALRVVETIPGKTSRKPPIRKPRIAKNTSIDLKKKIL
jgi:S-DNA-T family DNA segregation ATPase FtsK/SpoIIIE